MHPLLSATCAAALLVVAGCAGESTGTPATPTSFPESAFATVMSKGGGLAVAVRTAPDQPPSRGLVSVEYTITHDGAHEDGLVLDIVPWMPDMGHGTSTQPSVSAEGEGRYLITDVDLFMPGRWQLKTQITGPADDSVTPLFEVP